MTMAARLGCLTVMVCAIALGALAGDPTAAETSDPETPPADEGRFACRGNEPFWDLAIDGKRAVYGRLTGAMGRVVNPLSGGLAARDHLQPPLFVWRGRGESASGDIVAMITAERCLDTMSDEGPTAGVFDYRARVSMPSGEVLVGCCRADAVAAAPTRADALPIADLAQKSPDDWSRFLLDLLPAIDACIAQTPGPAPRVSTAWPMNHGMAGVRTRNGVGGRWQCIAPMIGGAVDRFDALPDAAGMPPGEGRIVFTPAASSPPVGECYRHERVLDTLQRLIGWLSYDTC